MIHFNFHIDICKKVEENVASLSWPSLCFPSFIFSSWSKSSCLPVAYLSRPTTPGGMQLRAVMDRFELAGVVDSRQTTRICWQQGETELDDQRCDGHPKCPSTTEQSNGFEFHFFFSFSIVNCFDDSGDESADRGYSSYLLYSRCWISFKSNRLFIRKRLGTFRFFQPNK